MCDFKEDVNKIYRKTAKLNLYSSFGKEKQRIINELKSISKDIDKLIEKLDNMS